MLDFFETTIRPNFNFWIYVVLMMIGLWALIAKRNYIKKLIGMSIFQTAIILFYVSLGAKDGATIPILKHHADHHGEVAAEISGESSHESDNSHDDRRQPPQIKNPCHRPGRF